MKEAKLSILVADASIEIVPKELWGHQSVKSDSKRRRRSPEKILLYLPIHFRALIDKGYSLEKRGRPDIAHRILLQVLGHPLNKMGLIKDIYVHTIENKIFWVNPLTRLPLDYYRFEGLIVQLFKEGRVPKDGEEKFMVLLDTRLNDLLEKYRGNIVLLSREGVDAWRINLGELLGKLIIIGGFQEGEIDKDILGNADIKISLGDYTLHASVAICTFLSMIYMDYIKTSSHKN